MSFPRKTGHQHFKRMVLAMTLPLKCVLTSKENFNGTITFLKFHGPGLQKHNLEIYAGLVT